MRIEFLFLILLVVPVFTLAQQPLTDPCETRPLIKGKLEQEKAPTQFFWRRIFSPKKSTIPTEKLRGVIIQEEEQTPILTIGEKYCRSERGGGQKEAERLAQEDFDKKKAEWKAWCVGQGGKLAGQSSKPATVRWDESQKLYSTSRGMIEEKYYCVELRQSDLCIIPKIIQI